MFNFPWSNFHELNLDWILSVVKEAKEIFVKGEGDIQHAVETADQALETAEQAAAGVIADGAVTIPKINGEVFSLFAYCVSGSVAPNFIPAGALVILRKSTIYNVTDGIYTATRNIPQAAIITAADLDQSATLYREGGMNYLLHNEEKLSGTIDLIKAGLVILVTGDEASAAIPADGLAYVTNNTHGLTEGFYFNSSGATFPPTGGTADSDSFTAVNNILNALQTAVATLGSDDIANDSTVTGVSVTDALDAVNNTLNSVESGIALINSGNTAQQNIPAGYYVYVKNNTNNIPEGLYQNNGTVQISSGATLQVGTGNGYLTAATNVLSDFATKSITITKETFIANTLAGDRSGNVCVIHFDFAFNSTTPSGWINIANVSSADAPKIDTRFLLFNVANSKFVLGRVRANTNIELYIPTGGYDYSGEAVYLC